MLEITSEGISQMAVVKAFRQSVNVLRPSKPAYSSTWDISIILSYIKYFGSNSTMDLKTLRLKVILLLRIDLLARSSDLAKLRRSELRFGADYFECRIYRPKEWRGESKRSVGEFSPWLKVTSYKNIDPLICSVLALREWISRTAHMVGPSAMVFCSLTRRDHSFTMLKSTTIAKLCSEAMLLAGVPANFKSQSMRGAAASAALDFGCNINEILHQGRWSDVLMFKKWYYRSIARPKLPVKKFCLVDAVRRGVMHL